MKTTTFLVLLVMLQAGLSSGSSCKKSWVNGIPKLDCTVIRTLMMIPPYYADDGNAITFADFSNNNFLRLYSDTKLSTIGYKDIRELKFQRCNITQVFKVNFEGLTILAELDLSSNKLESIQVGSFEGLIRLEKLDLSDNHLVTLDQRTLVVLTNLRKLYLSSNHFETLKIPGLVKAEKQNQTFWKMTEISLFDNPWRCDCELGPLHRDLKIRRLLSDRVSCGDSLSARWTQMTPSNFTCPTSLSVVSPTQMVDIGDNLTLHCKFEGNPMPKPLWTTPGGEKIKEDDTRKIWTEEEGSDYLGVVSIKMNLTILTAADAKSVECMAGNGVGNQVRRIIKISQFRVKQDSSMGLVVGLSILGGFALMSLSIGILIYLLWRKKFRTKKKDSSLEMVSPSSSVSTLPTLPTLPPMRRDQLDPAFINPLPKPPRTLASSRRSLALPLGPNDSHVMLTEQDELNCNYMTASSGPGPHLMFSNQSFASGSISDHPAFVSWLDNRPGSRASIVTVTSLVSSPPVLPNLVHSQTHPPSGQARPGYITLPRKPKQRPSVSAVDHLGPRTSGDGSSHSNISKISLTAMKFPPLPEDNQQLETSLGNEEDGVRSDTPPLQKSLLDPIPEQE